MTTKEFNRNVSYFKPLDRACLYFDFSHNPFIYSVSSVDSKGFVVLSYCIFPSSFLADVGDFPRFDFVSLHFDRFTFEQFEFQLKYFISFYNSCSELQRSKLCSMSDFCNLIGRINVSKK